MKETTPEQNQKDHELLNNSENETIQGDFSVYDIYKGNVIHPTAIIGENVKLGKNNRIGAYCVIDGDTEIGDDNVFVSHCSIGTEPEHKAFFGRPNKGLKIGNGNMFREFVTINAGCERTTELENGITMLRGSHIGHDSIISDNCTISCNVLIGGHSFLGEGVNMGLGSICHQFSKIGSYSMIGMGCIVTKKSDIVPFGVYVGSPAKYLKENTYQSLKKTPKEMAEIILDFNSKKI
jgi:UDP-N-acetylglucosamine acyltransferase